MFKKSIGAPRLKSHLAAVGILLIFGAIAILSSWMLPALVHSWIANVVLIAVVIGEEIDFRRERSRLRSLR